VIESLKQIYRGGNNAAFDFYVMQHVSGDNNKELRREIIMQITGERKPLTKCSTFATADVLKNSFQQYSLF
jgi:hypothetical protein